MAIISLIPSCKAKQMAATPETTVDGPESFVDPATGKIDYYSPLTWILGSFGRERLEQYPHNDWFASGYEDYVPESQFMNNLLDLRWDNVTIKVVMGTWCPDSRREVPRFLKVMDILAFPGDKISFIGTDMEKRSPLGGYEELNIQRVPTFIFYVNNSEAGRIIEVPTASLEEDMVSILFTNKKDN